MKLVGGMLCLSLVLASCTRPYSDPVVEEPGVVEADASFDGLLDHAARLPEGVALRVAVVHGMCDHDQKWASDRLAIYGRELNAAEPELQVLPTVGGIERYRAVLEPPGVAPLELIFVVWSPLSGPLKDEILYDAAPPDGEFPFQRAALNQTLKEELLNRCFADAIVYSGPAGEPIRRSMERVACELLGGMLDDRGVCRFADDSAPAALVFVTESLGSKVLFDAVRRLRERAEGADPGAEERLEAAVGRTQAVYMLANQVPLLDLAEAAVDLPDAGREESAVVEPRSSLHDFLNILRAGRDESATRSEEMRAFERVEVIAFTDPNDLLSYRLLPDEIGMDPSSVRLVNVIVSNAPAWLGFVERPDSAHMGYRTNAAVAELLVHGH